MRSRFGTASRFARIASLLLLILPATHSLADFTPAKEMSSVPLKIASIDRKHPDNIKVRNTSKEAVSLGSFLVCEHDPGETRDNCCSLDESVKLDGESTLTIWFFSAKDSEKKAIADQYKAEGKTVCDTFGISKDEIVELFDAAGMLVDKKKAE